MLKMITNKKAVERLLRIYWERQLRFFYAGREYIALSHYWKGKHGGMAVLYKRIELR
jgi:hypothetical protein